MKNGRVITSVALCSYNGERFIHAQLSSILEQTQSPDQVVICMIFYASLYLAIFAILSYGKNDLKFIMDSINQELAWKKEASNNE